MEEGRLGRLPRKGLASTALKVRAGFAFCEWFSFCPWVDGSKSHLFFLFVPLVGLEHRPPCPAPS